MLSHSVGAIAFPQKNLPSGDEHGDSDSLQLAGTGHSLRLLGEISLERVAPAVESASLFLLVVDLGSQFHHMPVQPEDWLMLEKWAGRRETTGPEVGDA